MRYNCANWSRLRHFWYQLFSFSGFIPARDVQKCFEMHLYVFYKIFIRVVESVQLRVETHYCETRNGVKTWKVGLKYDRWVQQIKLNRTGAFLRNVKMCCSFAMVVSRCENVQFHFKTSFFVHLESVWRRENFSWKCDRWFQQVRTGSFVTITKFSCSCAVVVPRCYERCAISL